MEWCLMFVVVSLHFGPFVEEIPDHFDTLIAADRRQVERGVEKFVGTGYART